MYLFAAHLKQATKACEIKNHASTDALIARSKKLFICFAVN